MSMPAHLAQALTKSREFLLSLARDVDEAHQLHQPIDGGNHCLWILGHLAVVDNGMIGQIDEAKSVELEGWWETFGMGSTPTDRADAYPSRQEVEQTLADRRQTLVGLVEGLSDYDLAKPTTGVFAAVAPTIGALLFLAVTHEGFHTGQLSVVRRSLGFDPNF